MFDDDYITASSDIEELAALALNSLLPEKSKEKYKKAFEKKWCLKKRENYPSLIAFITRSQSARFQRNPAFLQS